MPDLMLADPSFSQSAQIDMLIGVGILPSVILTGVRANLCGSLLGQETIFGWVISGPVPTLATRPVASFTTRISHVDAEPLEKLITKFWEVEDQPAKPVNESDRYCEENFSKTTRRSNSGAYVVTLPFRDPKNFSLDHSRSIALAQFLRNENRLRKSPQAKATYDAVLQEYLDLSHVRKVIPDHSTHNFYLPHHAVLKPDSTTTKVRVVFNESSRSSNGLSLNDVLHIGPVLQADLTLQILKWRFYKVVFNADITKMYGPILVDPKHTPFQRILFRDSHGEIGDYELNTVTFGVNCAPYLAIRVLQQFASVISQQHPRASAIIQSSMYVDDVLAGAHDEEEAVLMIQDLREALLSAGFPLRKWTANRKRILQHLPAEHLLRADFLEIEEASSAKTLGVRWNATQDDFYFVVTLLEENQVFTKRSVLSQIARLFDPAGWLAPFVIQAKLLMQKLWLRNLEWDQQLPEELVAKWKEFLSGYGDLSQIRVPRWSGFRPGARIQLHGFFDASQRAYAATIYIRVETDRHISCSLLVAKSQVAPVKTISLPRLELCGALLLADLFAAYVSQLPLQEFQAFFWTDSSIVLAWLNKPPCSWTVFLATRVAKIVNSTTASQWHHVRSEDNPTDLPSRGLAPRELVHSSLWWHGPEWLCSPQEGWSVPDAFFSETTLEQRPVKVNVAVAEKSMDLLDRFSKLSQALRVLAYASRFGKRGKKGQCHPSGELSTHEISSILQALIVSTQRRQYALEVECLSRKKPLPTSSSILVMNPFSDSHGVLRACGRLRLFYKAHSTMKFTMEELSTLMALIEACLNSRPISPMSEEVSDPLALTPGHFLVGGPLLSITEPEICEPAPSILNRWQRLKALNQQFCTGWKDEYLKELAKRNKWKRPAKNFTVGDLVVIKEDNLPPHEWRLGRIHATYPGRDGNVRVVDLLSARGLGRRPIAKLVLLITEAGHQPTESAPPTH